MTQENGTKTTGAENIKWNLDDLYKGLDAPEIEKDIQESKQRAEAFANTYRDKVATLSADEFLAAIREYEVIKEIASRLESYAYLIWTTDTRNAEYGKFTTRVRQHSSQIEQMLVFFRLEWMNAPEKVAALADDPVLADYSHYLKITRNYVPYALSEKEENIITELSLTGMQAWERYFSEVLSSARFELDTKQLNLSEVLPLLYSPERSQREKAANTVTAGLRNLAHPTTYVYNMMALHKQSVDKMRGHSSWIEARNLSNQTDAATVNTLIDSVTSRYDIVHRYYRLLKRLLGYDTLHYYDRYAPILSSELHVSWDDAKATCLDAFTAFSPEMSSVAQLFFDNQWIDAALAPNKRSGAYSSRAVASVHPYVFMNYTGSSQSVMTLAHELGHGIHQYLSRGQGNLQQGTPLTTAEMASTFGEMLVFDAILARTEDPKQRLAMRLEKITDTFATVFRQISMNRFEEALHSTVRAEGELTTERISELWLNTQRPMFGDSLELSEDYGLWWSYIPHFISVPGYVYAYAFGELLVWALYAKYQQVGGDFAQRYLEVLSKGGSVWPHELVAPLGVDLQAPDFWQNGLQLVEQMIILAEQEAAALDFKVR